MLVKLSYVLLVFIYIDYFIWKIFALYMNNYSLQFMPNAIYIINARKQNVLILFGFVIPMNILNDKLK